MRHAALFLGTLLALAPSLARADGAQSPLYDAELQLEGGAAYDRVRPEDPYGPLARDSSLEGRLTGSYFLTPLVDEAEGPLALLEFVIGVLLVLFGLRWLRKAILRAAGLLALHDERVAFAHETAALTRRSHGGRVAISGGLTAFNAVLLEGLEVVFIVIAVGAGRGMLPYAALGAGVAAALVLVAGAVLARPLSRVPENALKFVVGLMLTAFGIFWTGEGLGVVWPDDNLSLLGILVLFAALSAGAVRWLRPHRRAQLKVVK